MDLKDIKLRLGLYFLVFFFSLCIVFYFKAFFYVKFYYFFDVFFYDPATVFFFFLVTTHNQIMAILIFIFILVSWLLFIVLKNYGWFKSIYSKSFLIGIFNGVISDLFLEIRSRFIFFFFSYFFSFFIFFFNYIFFVYFSFFNFFNNDNLLNYFLKVKNNTLFWRFYFFIVGDFCLNVVIMLLILKEN